ncbi:MAG: L-threonylcarbamoyladenylate synthase [Candidatus Andersenbacteria bacterium]
MEITTDIKRAAYFIAQGRVVAFPTGTSYGLAVDACQGHALQRLRNLKRRPAAKSFTVCMAETLWPTYLNITATEKKILHAFSHQPLTLLVKPTELLVHLARTGYVGIRVIDHPLMEQLAQAVNVPLTATSANHAGKPPCFSPACISTAFPSKLDETTYDLSLAGVLDGGVLPSRPPTTIARLDGEQVKIIRAGSLTAAAITLALSQS